MKKIVALLVLLSMLMSAALCNADAVQSNGSSDWADDYIAQAKDIGLLSYFKGEAYKEPINREAFCMLIFQLIVITQNGITVSDLENKFSDTDNENVIVLNKLGIINGKSDTEFAPYDLLTREEAATIIVRMINAVMPMASTQIYFVYDDENEISQWASDSIQVISNLGFMNGVGDNKFAPQDIYTAEQSIATLIRIYNATRRTYEYDTPLGTVTTEIDCNSHINFGIEANVRIEVIKDKTKFDETRYIIDGPFKAFTDQTSSMYICIDDFAKIFGGEWKLSNNMFEFNYDDSKEVVMEKYTPNETTSDEWPNKTEKTDVVIFSDMPSIIVNGAETEIKGQYGGKEFNGSIMMYNNELYIPVQMVAELLNCDIAVPDIIWE